jgi:uncharacterized pyridoxal phosphate-containing UPF0001 family protein
LKSAQVWASIGASVAENLYGALDPIDRDIEIEKKRAIKSSFYLEFYLVFYPLEVERVNNKLEFGIRQFAENKIDGNKLKAICDEFIKCHTVAWQDGMPYWKSKEVNK